LLPHPSWKIHPENCVWRATNIGATSESSSLTSIVKTKFHYFSCSFTAHERQILEFYFLQIHLCLWNCQRSISS
jgi:hypothetical protein